MHFDTGHIGNSPLGFTALADVLPVRCDHVNLVTRFDQPPCKAIGSRSAGHDGGIEVLVDGTNLHHLIRPFLAHRLTLDAMPTSLRHTRPDGFSVYYFTGRTIKRRATTGSPVGREHRLCAKIKSLKAAALKSKGSYVHGRPYRNMPNLVKIQSSVRVVKERNEFE